MSFVSLLILSNMIANRLIAVGDLILPSAIIIFPLTYIIGDVVTELFGFRKAKNLIIASLILNCVFVAIGMLAVSLPTPTGATNPSAYSEVFSVAPRVALASISGFFAGSITNSFVMYKMKHKNRLQKFLFLRIFTSTVVGNFLDTCLFISVAFLGILDFGLVATMVGVHFSLKVIYETIFAPLTIMTIRKIVPYLNEENLTNEVGEHKW